MRIAFFTDSYLPNVDGVVSSIVNFKKELEKRGHEVYIFSPGTKEVATANKDPRIHYFTSTAFRPYPEYRVALVNVFSPLKIVKELNVDIIHSQGIATTGLVAIQTSKKFGIPCVATFHTLVSNAFHYVSKNNEIQTLLQRAAWKYLRWYFNSFPKTIVPSAYMQKLVEEKGILRTEILPSGIATEEFATKPEREKWKFKKDEKIVLHVGRIVKEKNLELLIKSAHSIINLESKVRFVIAGKGPALEYYKEMVNQEKLAPYFSFLGYVPQDDLRSLYASADCFVLPSAFETQGLVALESMAAGLPPVVLKLSAPAEVVQDGKTGFIFSDAFDFPGKVIEALKSKEKIGPRAQEHAQQYHIKLMTDRLLELYKGAKPCR